MASERILNEYDSTRIANAVDTLAENLAGYEAGTPATPTDAMKAKLPSQSTGDRISDAMEGLAQGLTNISHPQRISYEDWSALTPQEKANGTQYYIYDYPSVDGSLYAPVTSIATPENGNTASKPYAVGEMFIRGGKLCTCILAIDSGDTLTKDTNYKEGDVGSVLTELNSNWVTTTYNMDVFTLSIPTPYSFYAYCKCYGNIKELHIGGYGDFVFSGTGSQVLGTIKDNRYKPLSLPFYDLSHVWCTAIIEREMGVPYEVIPALIRENGTIEVTVPVSTVRSLYITATYL